MFSLLSARPLPAPFNSPHFLLSSVSLNMALSRAKTFARPKKTPALQAILTDGSCKCFTLVIQQILTYIHFNIYYCYNCYGIVSIIEIQRAFF